MVSTVMLDETGRACGVRYFQGGVERFQRTRMVAVAGYSIETPACCSSPPSGVTPTACSTTAGRWATT
jgi:hypothetical protein